MKERFSSMAPSVASSAASAQYLIYTFDFPKAGQRAQSAWSRYAALADEELALAQAQILSDTQKYRRIEVKKKYFDPLKGRAIDTTLRVYEDGKAERRLSGRTVMLGVVVLALAALAMVVLL